MMSGHVYIVDDIFFTNPWHIILVLIDATSADY